MGIGRGIMNDSKRKDDVLNRLKRIEGQIKGIRTMVEDDKYCTDILIQIAAARAALNKVSGIILEGHVKGCVSSAVMKGDNQVIDELIDTMVKFIK